LDYFKDLPDRRQRGKAVYPLEEILLLCLLAVIAGADSLIDIARFGEKKLDLLRRFRPFRRGHEMRCLSGQDAVRGHRRRCHVQRLPDVAAGSYSPG